MMKKTGIGIVSFLLAMIIFAGVAFAAPVYGEKGQVLEGDYIVIVNTNPDTSSTQSTGTIEFASDNPEPISNQPATGIVNSTVPLIPDNTLQPESASKTYALGESKFIGTKEYTLIGVGEYSYIWMENSLKQGYDTAGKTTEAANEMKTVYEGKPYQVLNALADGRIPYSDKSGKLSILLEDTGGSSGYFAGESDITAIHVNAPAAERYRTGALENRGGLIVH